MLRHVSPDRVAANQRNTGMSEVTATIFRDGNVIGRVSLEASMPQERQSEFIWIEILNPSDRDLSVLRDRFRLHSLAVDDSMSPAQLPKLNLYDDEIFAVVKIARLEEDEIKYADIDTFVSAHHIITLRHDEIDGYLNARDRFATGPKTMRRRPEFVLHAMLDLAVSSYFPVVQMIEDDVLSMEHRLLDAFLTREEVTRLFQLRRQAIQFQHVLTRMSDVCGKLANLDVPCIGAEVKPYFRDLHDQIVRVDAMISGLVDVIGAVFEASNLLEQQRQGVTIRQLAGWAAILGVPTAIAGVYGMNFVNMPELHSTYGYPLVVAVMLTSCLVLYIRFKKLHWL
jgi:magnesium transporter